jgi:hypothetical protein
MNALFQFLELGGGGGAGDEEHQRSRSLLGIRQQQFIYIFFTVHCQNYVTNMPAGNQSFPRHTVGLSLTMLFVIKNILVGTRYD